MRLGWSSVRDAACSPDTTPEDGKNVLHHTYENLKSQYPSRCREIICKCIKRAVLTEVVSTENCLCVQ